ncbi:MAG: DUF481 domain-containing protein [Psychromonas sp.]
MINSKLIIFSFINVVALIVSITLFVERPENKTSLSESNNPSDSDSLNRFTPVAIEPLIVEVNGNEEQLAAQQALHNEGKQQLQEKDKQLKKLTEKNNELTLQLSFITNELQQNSDYISAVESENAALNREIKEQLNASTALTLAPSDSDKMRDRIQMESEFNNTRLQGNLVEPEATAESDGVIDTKDAVIDAKAEESIDKLSGSVAFGFKYEQDNVVSRGLDGKLILDYDEVDTYNINSDLKFEFESEDKKTTTDKYRWQLQAGYNLDPRNIVFARTDLQRSEFSSYNKEDIYTLGYGRLVFDQAKHKFNVEIGPGYRMAEPNVGKDAISIDEFILRTRLLYSRNVTESLQINMDTVLEAGDSNSIYGFTLEAQNRIYRELYLIFEFDYKYTQNVPIDTVNQEVSTGLSLMYAF